MKRTMAAVPLVAAAALSLMGGPTAQAEPPALVITTVQDAVGHLPHTGPTGTFQSIGLPGCLTGTYADSLVRFSKNGTHAVVDETYTCRGGVTFTARLAVRIAATASDGTQSTQAEWRIVSSTTRLAGSGDAWGRFSGCSPIGAVFAECTGPAFGVLVGKIR